MLMYKYYTQGVGNTPSRMQADVLIRSLSLLPLPPRSISQDFRDGCDDSPASRLSDGISEAKANQCIFFCIGGSRSTRAVGFQTSAEEARLHPRDLFRFQFQVQPRGKPSRPEFLADCLPPSNGRLLHSTSSLPVPLPPSCRRAFRLNPAP